MDPVTFAAVAGGIGAASSALGAVTSGIAQGRAASYQSQVAANNATIERQNAQYAAQAGEAQAANASMANRAKLGSIKASEAANDIDVNTGSAAAVQESQRETGELNSETARNNALLQAYGYQSQATGFQAQSQLEATEAQEAPEAGLLSAGGSLLSNASSIGFKFIGGSGGSGGT